jgi:hypothetical protein
MQNHWRGIRPHLWWVPVAGCFGGIHLIQRLTLEEQSDGLYASLIYVLGRNPHHLIPGAWPTHGWVIALMIALTLFVLTAHRSRRMRRRFLASYALASVGLFGYGLLLYVCRLIPYLRYYWFRFADVMVPLLALLLVTSWLQQHLPRWRRARLNPLMTTALTRLARPTLWGVATVLIVVSTWQLRSPRPATATSLLPQFNRDVTPMLTWIANHTAPDAVFLVDPLLGEFYIYAQRAMFVSTKHIPHLNHAIIEWFKRLQHCNGGPPRYHDRRAMQDLHRNFYQLRPALIQRIAREYPVTYYLGKTSWPLPFEAVHTQNGYTLYRIEEPGPSVSRRQTRP